MITSILYTICFIILLTTPGVKVKILSCIFIVYILVENILFLLFYNSESFDIVLYLTCLWALDSVLLFCIGASIKGIRQTAITVVGIPLFLTQVFCIQFPQMFPTWIFVFSVQDAHRYFIEVGIFVHSWRDNTVKEWLRTSIMLAIVITCHLI